MPAWMGATSRSGLTKNDLIIDLDRILYVRKDPRDKAVLVLASGVEVSIVDPSRDAILEMLLQVPPGTT